MPIVDLGPMPEQGRTLEESYRILLDSYHALRREVQYYLEGLDQDNIPAYNGNFDVTDSDNVMFDVNGYNPSYLRWFSNIVSNSEFMCYDITTSLPDFWSGAGVTSSESATFISQRSMKITAASVATYTPNILYGNSYINPQWFIEIASRGFVSFWSKGGQVRLKVYDQTGAAYITLKKSDGTTATSIDFTANTNWVSAPHFCTFAASTYTDLRLEITNIGATDLYISAPQVSYDRTTKYPQLYIEGKHSIAVGGVSLDESLHLRLHDLNSDLDHAVPANYNLAVGSGTLASLTAGASGNSVFGYHAAYKNTGGEYNTAMGYEALYENTDGDHNTAIGRSALESNTTGTFNVAIGNFSMSDGVAVTGGYNVGVGGFALHVITTGGWNVAVGDSAAYHLTEGRYNIAVGPVALDRNLTGDNNIAIGYKALFYTTVSDNIGIGPFAGYQNTQGYDNVFLGNYAASDNTVGYENTAVGSYALQHNVSGDDNVVVGAYALGTNTTGSNNTVVGASALTLNTGSNNTVVGYYGMATNAGSGSVALGYYAGYYETGSNKLFIDNAQRASEADGRIKALIYGIFDAAVANQQLVFNASVGVNITPTARLTLPAGTATASTAPLKFTAGTNLTAVENGAMEFNGTSLYLTVSGSRDEIATSAKKLSFFAATSSAELAGVISDETGSGSLVFATSPILVTPTLGVASATSINKVAITAPATGSTLTIAEGKTLTVSKTIQFTSAGDLAVLTLPNATATIPATSDKLSVFAATTSAELAGVISDETGSGALVFATSPALVTPTVDGVAISDLNLDSNTDFLKGVKGTQSLTNLMSNGNFANGTTGWTVYNGTHAAANNVLSSTGDGSSLQVTEFNNTSTACVLNNKIYVKATARVTNASSTVIRLAMGGSTGGAVVILDTANPVLNQWYTVSGVGTIDGTLSGNVQAFIAHAYADVATANGKVMEVQEVLVIDLTAEFGAGNEPTAAAMDTMIDNYFDGWFDGTKYSGVSYATRIQYMTSAELATAITDETGTGVAVFGTSPTFTTQITTPLIYGSAVADGDITIDGTSHATKTTSYVILQSTGGKVGIGTTAPDSALHVDDNAGNQDVLTLASNFPAAGNLATHIVFQDSGYETTKIGAFHEGSYLVGISFQTLHAPGALTEKVRITAAGNVGIGITAPTAVLHLKAGTATASTAPLKFTSGTLLTTPEAGAMEFYDGRFYITGTALQRAIDRTSSAVNVANVTVANTVTETTLYSWTLSANAMRVGRIYKVHLDGIISSASAADDITINLYFGGTLYATANPAMAQLVTDSWHLDANITIRTTGASGTAACHGDIKLKDTDTACQGLFAIDTTAADALTVKVQWDNAKVGNTISLYQAYLELKN